MPTDHAVVTLGARMGRGDLLEASDVAHTDANAELDSLSQRPVGPPQRTAQVIDAVAQHDTCIIHCIAETREPGCARDHAVELIAVHDEETLAARGAVYPLAVNLKLSAQHLRHHGETRVVVAGNVNEPGAGSPPGEQRAHHLSVLRRPEEAPRETERIDNVADEHDAFGLDAVQELVQLTHPCTLEAEVNIGEKKRPRPRLAGTPATTIRHGFQIASSA